MDDFVKATGSEPAEAADANIKRRRGGARGWPETLKREAVDACPTPGARVIDIARRYGVHPQQLTSWRRAAREGRLEAGCEKGCHAALFGPDGSQISCSNASELAHSYN